MNHLAHVFLAPDSPEARVGSILGDFTRGVDLSTLPDPVKQGVRHHRAVDSFTDQHPDVLASKQVFSRQRRRFAGVARLPKPRSALNCESAASISARRVFCFCSALVAKFRLHLLVKKKHSSRLPTCSHPTA